MEREEEIQGQTTKWNEWGYIWWIWWTEWTRIVSGMEWNGMELNN